MPPYLAQVHPNQDTLSLQLSGTVTPRANARKPGLRDTAEEVGVRERERHALVRWPTSDPGGPEGVVRLSCYSDRVLDRGGDTRCTSTLSSRGQQQGVRVEADEGRTKQEKNSVRRRRNA